MPNVPEFMPVLSAGPHDGPEQGACVMELVSYMAGEPWSDRPVCTNPALARMAQIVNDRLTDNRRHLLVPLIGRLFGTDKATPSINVSLARWCAVRAAADAARAATNAACAATNAAADAACAAFAARAATNAAADAANCAAADAACAAFAARAATNAAADAANCAAADAACAAFAAAGDFGVADYADSLVTLLSDFVDEYDRLTGRTAHKIVTPGELSQLASLTQ